MTKAEQQRREDQRQRIEELAEKLLKNLEKSQELAAEISGVSLTSVRANAIISAGGRVPAVC